MKKVGNLNCVVLCNLLCAFNARRRLLEWNRIFMLFTRCTNYFIEAILFDNGIGCDGQERSSLSLLLLFLLSVFHVNWTWYLIIILYLYLLFSRWVLIFCSGCFFCGIIFKTFFTSIQFWEMITRQKIRMKKFCHFGDYLILAHLRMSNLISTNKIRSSWT